MGNTLQTIDKEFSSINVICYHVVEVEKFSVGAGISVDDQERG